MITPTQMKAFKKIIKPKNYSRSLTKLRWSTKDNMFRASDSFIMLIIQYKEKVVIKNDFSLEHGYIDTIKSFDFVEDYKDTIKVMSNNLWYEIQKNNEEFAFPNYKNFLKVEKDLFGNIVNTDSIKTFFDICSILDISESQFLVDKIIAEKEDDHIKIILMTSASKADIEK